MEYLKRIGLFENFDILCLPQSRSFDILRFLSQYNSYNEDGSDDESKDRTDDDISEDEDGLSQHQI